MPPTPENPLTPAPLPPVQRLSRAVLVAAAGLVTVTLLAVAFFATPRPVGPAPPLARPPAAADPGFLQRPPATAPPARPELTEQEYLRRLLERGPQPPSGAAVWGNPGAAGTALPGGTPLPEGSGGVPSATAPLNLSPPPAPPRDLRREAFLRALHAPLAQPVAAPAPLERGAFPWPAAPSREALGDERTGRAGVPGTAVLEGPSPFGTSGAVSAESLDGSGAAGGQRLSPPRELAGTYPPLPPFRSATGPARLSRSGEVAGPDGAATPGFVAGGGHDGAAGGGLPAADANALESESLPAVGAGGRAAGSGTGGGSSRLDGRRAGFAAGGLAAGTVIPALLLTAVNSDLPGPLMAQVSRDVYDLGQRRVVLARGTRLFGRYDNQVAVGQRRLLVAWTRLQRLDGTILELPGLPGTDVGGAAGLPARTQNHLLRLFGDAVLLSVLSAGAELSQPPSRSLLVAPSAGSVTSAAVGQQLSDIGLQLLRRDLAIQPTLRLPAGTPLTVFVNADLPLGDAGSAAAAADGSRLAGEPRR